MEARTECSNTQFSAWDEAKEARVVFQVKGEAR
jgi:hypothetical protein